MQKHENKTISGLLRLPGWFCLCGQGDSKKQCHGKEGINQEWEKSTFQAEGRPL